MIQPTTGTTASVHRLLDNLARPGFYGSVIVRYQDGRIVHVIEERSYRPDPSLPCNLEETIAESRPRG
jgi:hypothetical protein